MPLKILDSGPDASKDELAQLEYMYLPALDHGDHGIPNLEKQLSNSPSLFMQAVGLTYRRDDDGQDPPEWRPSGANESIAVQPTVFCVAQDAFLGHAMTARSTSIC